MNNFFNKLGLRIALIASAAWIAIATLFVNISRISLFNMDFHIKLWDLTGQNSLTGFVADLTPFLIIFILVIGLAITQVVLAFNKNTKLAVWFGVGAQVFNIFVFAAATPIINGIIKGKFQEQMMNDSSSYSSYLSKSLYDMIDQYKFTPDLGVYLVIIFALLTIMYLVSYYTATFRNSNDAPRKIELAKGNSKSSAKKTTAKKTTTKKTTAKSSTSKATASKSSASKSTASKAATKKEPAKKTAAKKPATKKSSSKASTAKKTTTKKTSTKSSTKK